MKKEKIIKILKAIYLSDYKINILFSDSKNNTIDFYPFLSKSNHPDIQKYINLKYFKKFKIIDGDLLWGDFDLCFPINDLYNGEI